MAIHKRAEIKITIGLDANKIPESIVWDAIDGGVSNEEAKALMMGVWDDKTSECLRIDLWTKDMSMDDMKRMFHQTFISMADGYDALQKTLHWQLICVILPLFWRKIEYWASKK